jgi:hypothetical protein
MNEKIIKEELEKAINYRDTGNSGKYKHNLIIIT